MEKILLVEGLKEFRVKIPEGAKITFGPFSPPSGKATNYGGDVESRKGTLRIYENHTSGASIIAVFSGVTAFRDVTLEYSEKVAVEEGASIWKSDQNGYEREDKKSVKHDWVDPLAKTPQLIAPKTVATKVVSKKKVK